MSEANENSAPASGEFLLLPDGTLLIHNLTPAIAEILARVNGVDANLQSRLGALAEAVNNPNHAENSSGN